ncbi:MAG: hypothetical protein Aurels2KO_58370 [Aureliella sp.]
MLLKIDEVAERLKISLSFAYALVNRGEIACYQIGGCKRVDEDELQSYLQRVKHSPVRLPANIRKHF